jgi:periplasmic divalent cation tolerance protein
MNDARLTSNRPADLLAVYTTVATREQVDALARMAVEPQLAACVQVEAIHSTFRWQGEVVSEPELRLMFQTTRTHYAELEALLRELHPYEVLAIFALPVVLASTTFANWLQGSLH